MLKSTPVRVLEAWGGQKTGLGIDKKFNPDLTQEECAKVAEFIRENGFSLNGISAQAKTREEAEKRKDTIVERYKKLVAYAKELNK